MALEFTDANFEETVLKSDKPVLVDFWAEWCGPCRMVGPIVDELHGEYDGKALVGKVNVDNNPGVAALTAISVVWADKTVATRSWKGFSCTKAQQDFG